MDLENQIIEAFTGKANLDDSTEQQWTGLIAQYPAFNLGYYFRAKKQGQADNKTALQMRRQAAVHFNDIRWLDYLLRHKTIDTGCVQKTAAPDQTDSGVQQCKASVADHTVLPDAPAQPDLLSSPPVRQPAAEEVPLPEKDNARLSAVLSAQLADFKKPVAENARLEVERDPLYKVDYFASQGISLLKDQDGFDKKVRRFTDWLKEMKQQHTDPTGPQLNTTPQEEARAAEKAEESLKNEPVWTESMAEVLADQGKTAQAREVYQKLSLLYPEKSTYFASKIDLLQ